MSARIVQVDLAGELPTIRFLRTDRTLLLLVKFGLQPLGWVECRVSDFGLEITPDQLGQLISQSLSLQVHDVARQRLFESRNAATVSFSVVICTRENPASLRRLLESLGRLQQRQFETIVIDNAPRASSTRDLCAEFGVRQVVEPRRGLGYARNTGWQVARNDVLAYLSDDAFVDPHWLSALADNYRDASVQSAFGDLWPTKLDAAALKQFKNDCVERGFNRKLFAPLSWTASFPRAFPHLREMCFSARRDAIERIGGFDAALGKTAAQWDAMIRILRDDGTIVHDPRAIAFDQRRQTGRTLRRRSYAHSFEFAGFCAKYFADAELANLSLLTLHRWMLQSLSGWQFMRCAGAMMGVRSYRRARRRVRNDSIRFVQKGIVRKAA